MVLSKERVAESRRLAFTYFVGFMKRSRAPQKVRPRPIRASMDDENTMDVMRPTVPESSTIYATVPERLRLYKLLHSLYFRA